MNLILICFVVLLASACKAEPHLPPGTKPLPSAAPNGRGPLALVNLNHHVLGHGFVFGGRQPDLFVAGYGGPQAVHLFRWVDTAETGAPVFAEPVQVKCLFKDKGTVFQTANGSIHGLWLSKGLLVHTVFDRKTVEFRETARIPLEVKIASASSLAALPNADGSYDLAFEVSDGGKGPKGHPWTEEWRPFNSSGIAVDDLRYRYLFGGRLPSLLKGPLDQVRQITITQREVYFSMHGITAVNLGPACERDLITGSRQGNLVYYRNRAAQGFQLEARRLVAGEDGNALRHPSINPSVCAYPSLQQGMSDNVIDWNGDSLPDIITGDITGNYMIYLNRGTPKEPRLDPAHPLYCDGIDLHGMWRVRPAVANINGRMALAIVDGDDHFHLYRRIDDYNVDDGGKLLLSEGRPIGASGGVGGMSGRCNLDFFDWNEDGNLDLVIGTNRVNSIPDRESGLPMPAIGKKTLGTPLLMLNAGTNARMKFAMPVPFRDKAGAIIQPGGAHETGAIGTMLGGDGPNLLVCNEAGRLFLLPRKALKITQ